MWWIKLRSGGQRVEKSLGTQDRREAELLALPLIAEHKARLIAARPRFEPQWVHWLKPGHIHDNPEQDEHPAKGPEGCRIVATERELTYLDAAGAIIRTTPNGAPGFTLDVRKLRPGDSIQRLLDEAGIKPGGIVEPPAKLARREIGPDNKPTGDDGLIEAYIAHANVTGYKQKEVRDVWALYKTLVGKPLKDADRDDGRKLVTYYREKGLKRNSIRKLTMWLRSAVNLAIDERKLRFNPFKGIVPKAKGEWDDALMKVPFDENDMRLIKKNLGKLAPADQLLVRFLAATGARLEEAFHVNREMVENRIRYAIIGRKTKQSLRRVVLPSFVPPVKRQLFSIEPSLKKAAHNAGKRINDFLRDLGISKVEEGQTQSEKTVHSFRHRAEDQMKAGGVEEDIRDAVLGHNMQTISRRYGLGFPTKMLKKGMDAIGNI